MVWIPKIFIMKITLERLIIIFITLFVLYQWWNNNNYATKIEDIQRKYDTKARLLDEALKNYAKYRDSMVYKNDSLMTNIRLREKDFNALESKYKGLKENRKNIKKDELQGVIDSIPFELFTD